MGRTGEQRRWEKMRGELEVSLKVKDMQRREIFFFFLRRKGLISLS